MHACTCTFLSGRNNTLTVVLQGERVCVTTAKLHPHNPVSGHTLHQSGYSFVFCITYGVQHIAEKYHLHMFIHSLG